MNIRTLCFDKLSSFLRYEPASNSGLVWVNTTHKGNHCNSIATRANEIAGSIVSDKGGKQYWVVKVQGVSYRVSRVIFLLHNPDFDQSLLVDHIDGNSLNNNISNLRLVNHSQNAQNRRLDIDSTSGILGVQRVCYRGRFYWQAKIHVDGRVYTKTFSIEKYGEDCARSLAISHRQQFAAAWGAEGHYFK